MKQTLVFLLGVLSGIVLVIGAEKIGEKPEPGLLFPYQGTVLLYPKEGDGLVMGATSRHATSESCSEWLKAAQVNATPATLGRHFMISECQ